MTEATAAGIAGAIRQAFDLTTERPAEPLDVDDRFRTNQNHPAGIRPPHAIDAVRDATAVDRYDLGENTFRSLALAPVTLGRPYLMLVICTEAPGLGAGARINEAWRVYDAEDGSPTDVYAAFLERFGLDVQVDDVRQRFIPQATTDGEVLTSISFDPDKVATGAFQVTQMLRHLPDGSTEVTWLSAVDIEAYNVHVAHRRR